MFFGSFQQTVPPYQLGKVYFAECRISKRCILRNFTCGTFCKLHLRVFPHSAKFK